MSQLQQSQHGISSRSPRPSPVVSAVSASQAPAVVSPTTVLEAYGSVSSERVESEQQLRREQATREVLQEQLAITHTTSPKLTTQLSQQQQIIDWQVGQLAQDHTESQHFDQRLAAALAERQQKVSLQQARDQLTALQQPADVVQQAVVTAETRAAEFEQLQRALRAQHDQYDGHGEVLRFPDPGCEQSPALGMHCGDRNCVKNHSVLSSFKSLLRYLGSATTTLEVCMHVIACVEVYKVLLAVHKRIGDGLRIFTTNVTADNDSSKVRLLQDAGINTQGIPEFLHSKFAILDNFMLLQGSSYNYSERAHTRNVKDILVHRRGEFLSTFQDTFATVAAWVGRTNKVVPSENPSPNNRSSASAPHVQLTERPKLGSQ